MTTFPLVQADIELNIQTFSNSCTTVMESFPLSKAWVERDILASIGVKAEALIKSSQIALLETCSTWGCGFNRAAAASLRSFCESTFAWLYYKDHPVEYDLVERRLEDILLPKAVQSYLKKIDPGFESSYGYLSKFKTRTNEYYYTDLSYFVHSHPAQISSQVDAHKSVISCPPEMAFATVCNFVDEFISDNYAANLRHSWGAIPAAVQENLESRLGLKLQKFLAE